MSMNGKKSLKHGSGRSRGASEPPRTPSSSIRSSAMLLSGRELTVSGCRRILEYASCRIKLSVAEGTVTVEGRGLYVCTYRGDELTVRGWLSGIFFDDKALYGSDGREESGR